MMPMIYVACPYNSGLLSVEENAANARILTRYAAMTNENPFSPVCNYACLDKLVKEGTLTERHILELCLETLIKKCQAIMLAPNWYTSTGARIELAVAEALKYRVEKPTTRYIEEVTGERYQMEPF